MGYDNVYKGICVRLPKQNNCQPGYHWNTELGDCEANTCICRNGMSNSHKDSTDTCDRHETTECFSCYKGYVKEYVYGRFNKTICVRPSKKCTCDHGIPVSGDKCEYDGYESCDSCNTGFEKKYVHMYDNVYKGICVRLPK